MTQEEYDKLVAQGFDPEAHELLDESDPSSGFKTKTVTPELVIKPVIQLGNFVVKSDNTVVKPKGGIYWVGTDDKLEVTADVVDTDNILASMMSESGQDTLSMVIITQEVFNGDYSNVKDSTRFKVDIANNVMTLVSNKGFGLSGNYIVTQERLNLGLDNLGAPFHIEMDAIEFDVLNG